MNPWDPDRYLTFADERGRPFVELLARISTSSINGGRSINGGSSINEGRGPRTVVDLGCGPGNLTRLLQERWPEAQVTGVDSSPAMVERARAAGIRAELQDLRDWSGTADVVVSNATLQWVPEHLELLPRLAASARRVFAFQVPANFDEPSHVLREQLAAEPPYRPFTEGLARSFSHQPVTYLEALQEYDVDAWSTTYLHVLRGEDAVFEWISGTSLLPTRAALPPDLFEQFAAELKRRLRAAYPARNGRTVMPFRRTFVVATRA